MNALANFALVTTCIAAFIWTIWSATVAVVSSDKRGLVFLGTVAIVLWYLAWKLYAVISGVAP